MDPKFTVELNGRTYPLFAGILAEAHERGLQGIETQLIQIPGADNDYTAIVKAVVRMKDGSVFEDYGDANPRNTNARIVTALIRMASTRAKGRALRDAINVGQTMLEELPDLDESETGPVASPTIYEPSSRPRSVVAEGARARGSEGGKERGGEHPTPGVQQPAPAANGDGKLLCSNPSCGKPLTKGQHDISIRAYGQPFCPSCQKIHAKLG